MLWLDIEGRWNRNIDINIQFIEELIQQINNLGIKFGIYTSRSQWISIMNNITKFSSDSPLWYPHYDNHKSFNDFRAFGGWRRPSIKQFISNVKECGVILDRNFS
jgi:GH25 family lysozyme M1 (1,4-beta-N-acetylmuramidase)